MLKWVVICYVVLKCILQYQYFANLIGVWYYSCFMLVPCCVLNYDIEYCNVLVVCYAMDVFRASVLPPQGWSAGTPSLHATSTQAPQDPFLSPGPHFYPQGLHPPAPHCPYPSLSPAPALCTPRLQWLRAPPQVSVQASFTFPCSHPDPYITVTLTLVLCCLYSHGGVLRRNVRIAWRISLPLLSMSTCFCFLTFPYFLTFTTSQYIFVCVLYIS